ncbi:NAD-dependent epimerase/dehydratase family protein, partial [Xanthomonas citri pv. citri]|nr:NAD-dependent epimerase/dehydratase family protein [Xanthomonas citri pv. citri]
DPLVPTSPYSASKAGSDLVAQSFFRSFNLPVVVTRCSNNYGPHQFPEKLIPLFVTNLMEGKKVPVYGDGSARRDWLHVTDHCRG